MRAGEPSHANIEHCNDHALVARSGLAGPPWSGVTREATTDMANSPKKTIDPTEAALSAIQEALNIPDEEPAPPAIESYPVERKSPVAPPAFHEHFEPDPVAARPLDVQAPGAANDDRQSIGQILQALQRRPSRTSYFVAAIFSAAWIVGCLALSWAYLPDFVGPGHSTAGIALGLGAAALLPIIFFFGVAHMAWRGQELRLIAQAMAGVAMRLAEPESVAQDSIVSVGQAIRREVAAMGDGVERALARASELETLVQNEVAALARTYGDNEARIRGLIQDLANQRDTLVSQAEQVRSAINNVHIDLTQDLSTISDLVGQQVNEAAQRITHSLAEKGEHITLSLGEVGDNMIQQLSVRGSDLLDRLENTSTETARAIATASDRLTSSLSFKTDHISEEFAEIAQGLEDMMTARLDRVTDTFSEKALATVDMMVGRSQEITELVSGRSQELTDLITSRSQELTESIVETSSQIAEKIAAGAEEVNSTLRTSGESLLLDLNLRGGEVASKLEQAGTRITDALVSRSAKMTDSVRDSAEQLVSVITSRSDAMKDMLTTRLAAYEEMFNHSGVELGERISRDSANLGNLITRHLSEFDRTVKTYGSELVERLGARTQDVSESMRSYIDTFDNRVTSKANEVTTSLDQRLSRFQETLDSRTEALTEALSTRVMEIAKTLAEGGKEVVAAVDSRVSDVANVIDSRGQKLADLVGERVAAIDQTLGANAQQVAETLDGRITQLEQLLIGRAETVVRELDVRGRAAADLLNSRLVALSDTVKSSSAEAERTLTQLLATTTDSLGKSVTATAAATEALNRSAAEATATLDRSANSLSGMITKSAIAAGAAIDKTTATSSDALGKSAAALTQTINQSAAAATHVLDKSVAAVTDAVGKSAASASQVLEKSAASLSDAIGKSATAASQTLGSTASNTTELMTQTARTSADAISRCAGEAERTLVGMSADIVRNISDRADEIQNAVGNRVGEMTRSLDERTGEIGRVLEQKSGELVATLAGKGEQFAAQVGRVTDQAVQAIEAKGFVFTQTMMENSEEIARLINEAGENATTSVTRTLGQFQEGTQGVADAAKTAITRTLQELHDASRTAIEESKQTASATVADMLQTHGMLRTDSTALFERLREANILLQEVLSGAHENMNAIEHTMVARVSEFVAAMNDLNTRSGTATSKVEEHLGAFNRTTVSVLHDLSGLATQFSTHGRSLAEAVELLERSNRRTEDSIASRHASIDTLVTTLDARTDDFEQRLRRFSGLLDESLDSATARAREIASIVAETSNESVHTIEQQFEIVRAGAEEQRKRTSQTFSAVYEEASGEVSAMFTQAAERFADIMQGMKQMAADMHRELETTRAELRRGVFELPQETADSAAQMRRVIVDQIEALAELNRIVARHGRALDAVEPVRREAEPAYAAGGGRAAAAPQPRPVRSEISGAPARPQRDITGAPTRRPEAPALSPIQGGKETGGGRNGAGGGWLSDLLTRASRDRDDAPPISPSGERGRDSVSSLESLSVDIARMIDHEATAELWERYQRGERGLGGRKLYTAQGQRAFEEIRNKYRSDPEFRQTVEHYIHEFERLLDDVSRGDRGPTVARNYLTSDTGKVYTMLAHAAGRFE